MAVSTTTTSPLRPKRRSAPASTNADPAQIGNGQSSSTTPPMAVVNQAGPSSASSSTSHLRPHITVRPKILTIHTSDFSSPSSSPGHSPPGRIRPLPRVPDTASSDCSSFSPRPLPPTPASSASSSSSSCSSSSSYSSSPPPTTSTSTTFRQALVLSPDQLPRRKESLAPLFTPHIVLPVEEKLTSSHCVRSPPVEVSYTARRGHGLLGNASGGLEVIPPSPVNTTVSALIFRRASPDDSDMESDDDKDVTEPGVCAQQGRCTSVMNNYALSSPPSSPGHSFSNTSLQPLQTKMTRESRHWYREENGTLVEQDYDQVLRSLRSLR